MKNKNWNVWIIFILILIAVMLFFILFPKDDKKLERNEEKHEETPIEKANISVVAYEYGDNEDELGYLYAIDDNGENTTIARYSKIGYKNYDVIDNKLYYIGEESILYEIDLNSNTYSSKELFKVNQDKFLDLEATNGYVYVAGINDIYRYELKTKNKKEITTDLGNKFYVTKDNKYLFYTKDSNIALYRVDLSSNNEYRVLDDARILYANDEKLYLESGFDTIKYYIYDIKTDELKEYGINLDKAFEYNNKIVYFEDKIIKELSYDGLKNNIYDFKNQIDGIANILPLGGKLLIVAKVNTRLEDEGKIKVPVHDMKSFILDIKTKKLTELIFDYGFLDDTLKEYVIVNTEF